MAQDPPGIDWKQIHTEHYHIIFPNELGSEANRVANTMEHVHQSIGSSLESNHRKIPILLSNRGAIPNGFVGQTPWMSEWFNIPLMMKGMGATEWYRDLAVHEGRHIIQYNYLNRGVSRFVGSVFGESTQSFYTGLLIPSWFWEGDAVGIETVLTHAGRGRSSQFNRSSRALILEGKKFNYRQALYGSFKQDYPGHYELGYLLTNHVNRQFGDKAWPKILSKTMWWPFTLNPFFPFSRSMKKTTGFSISQIHNDTFFDLKEYWSQQLENVIESSVDVISPKPKVKTDYLFPAMNQAGEIITLKTGLGHVPTIVTLANGKETPLTKISSVVPLFGYHSNGDYAVWSSYDPDKRWTKLSWANIRVFDIQTGELRKITSKKRLYNPNISPNGNRIAAVSFSENRHSLLVILDAKTGEIIDQVESPNGGLIMSPSWSTDGQEIVFTSQKFEGRGICTYRPGKREFEQIKSESWIPVFKPMLIQNYVIYESQIEGVENLVAIHRKDKLEYQVTSRKFGATNASRTQDGRLLFNDYSSMGDAIAIMAFNPNEWKEISTNRTHPIQGLSYSSELKPVFDEPVSTKSYNVSDYKTSAHLFNFHSRYIFDDVLNPSLGIQSNNILGTFSFGGEISYNKNEKTTHTKTRGTYSGFYPMINFDIGIGKRNVGYGPFYQKVENRNDTLIYNVNEKWNESTVDFGMSIPFKNELIGIRTKYAFAKIGAKYIRRSNTVHHFDFLSIPPNIRVTNQRKRPDRDGNIIPVYIESAMISIDEKSPRDLGSPGWQVYGYAGGMPFGGIWKGEQISLRAIYGIKGLGHHHYISSLFQWETNEGDYSFPSKIGFPKGYNWHGFNQGWRIKVKYEMPLFYPDWTLPFSISYLKRIKGNIFVDQATMDQKESMLSVGAGITFESGGFFDIRMPIPLTINFYFHPHSGETGIQFDFE
ncbi:MAG: PD40 domain-containing protein [Candidatus Marinimicrobia bacterium]|nr:PD40 domain-containing protein [Candidatus Neomarinimicrobiota bacterium]MBL7010887.1 PD40 domain-containing protein [Candidatus Neomarinimicrobiota bacterium]MBL7030261.1 PD40 domain-containing protein [Candidatus Neomarinimicrobiota bacterium]